MTEMFLIGAGLLVIGIAIGAVLSAVFARMGSLERRLNALEDCQKKRLPYNTAAGTEDAIAVMLDVLKHSTEIDLERDALQQRAEKVMDILRMVRGGPENYDPEKPAGRRP